MDVVGPFIECYAVNCVKYRVVLSCSSSYVYPFWHEADMLYVVV